MNTQFVKISELPAGGAVDPQDLFVSVQDGVTVKVTGENFTPFFDSYLQQRGQKLRLTALDSILAYRLVTTDVDGNGIYASSGNALHVDQVIGISTQAASAGMDFEVADSGFVTNQGWTWQAGQPLFLGLDGEVVSHPIGVFSMQIGYAKTATTIYLRIGRGVLRA